VKNAKGSKSVPSAKGKKAPAKALTTAGKPKAAKNPSRKPATVAILKAEVPEWAQRAAARDTASEMAAVPESSPVTEGATETPTPTPTKGRAPKATKAMTEPDGAAATPAVPGSVRAVGIGWLESLRAAGHSPATTSSYENDLAVAYEHFGADAPASEITEHHIATFNASEGVTRTKTGKPKAKPTILKTQRAFRLALVWAERAGVIAKAPFAVKAMA
jgi:hypothetical protein